MPKSYCRVLSIAGSDSGGGAGVQADIKTISALGCFATTAVTAVTAQSTLGVTAIAAVEPKIVAQQIETVLEDIGANAIKVGMLANEEVIQAVVGCLKKHPNIPIVLDPVMVATSGDVLVAPETVNALTNELFPLATLVTPNAHEARVLVECNFSLESSVRNACREIAQLGAQNVLIKGGDVEGNEAKDILYSKATDSYSMFTKCKIPTKNTHGTGCTYSSAIACYLGLGHALDEAVGKAKNYIQQAIDEGSGYSIGQGRGPLHHFNERRESFL